MKDPEKERSFRDTAIEKGSDEYRRLLSYFYRNDIQTVVDMKREEMNGNR